MHPRREDVVGREVVEAGGDEAVIVASVPGHTSALVGKSQMAQIRAPECQRK
jgi:hypothetical protein